MTVAFPFPTLLRHALSGRWVLVCGLFLSSCSGDEPEPTREGQPWFEEVAAALIYSASAQAVVDRSGWTRVAMSYRVYNRSRQFLVLQLPKDAQLYSVLVAGKGVRPLTKGGKVMVPLRKVASSAGVTVTESGAGARCTL